MTTRNILEALATYAPDEITRVTKPGPRCVLATRVGQLVLAQFKVTATPFPVVLTVFNEAWRAWGDADFAGGQDEQLKRGAHILTNAPDWQGQSLPSLNPATAHPWDGHLVLRVPDATDWLVDLDLGQCARPTKAILLPPAVVTPLMKDNTVEGQFVAPDGVTTYVTYQPLVAPYAEEYVSAKDWRRTAREYAPVVEAITRKIRVSLGKP